MKNFVKQVTGGTAETKLPQIPLLPGVREVTTYKVTVLKRCYASDNTMFEGENARLEANAYEAKLLLRAQMKERMNKVPLGEPGTDTYSCKVNSPEEYEALIDVLKGGASNVKIPAPGAYPDVMVFCVGNDEAIAYKQSFAEIVANAEKLLEAMKASLK